MDPSFLLDLLYFIIFSFLAAFILGLKSALFNLNTSTVQSLSQNTSFTAKQILVFLKKQRKFILTVVIVNLFFASFAVVFAVKLADTWAKTTFINNTLAIVLMIIGFFFVYMFFREFLLKYFAVKKAKHYSEAGITLFTIFYYIFSPIMLIVLWLSKELSAILGLDKSKRDLSDGELRNIVDADEEGTTLKKDEREMINSIFEMGETLAREIMVPRPDMICVEATTSMTQLLKINKEKNHSRIPVYKDSVDNIVGILHVKDLLPLIKRRTYSDFNIMKLANPPHFVPQQKKINDLLREFRTERIHMAIVVDEYGGTAGIVTLEDVIEEIVGEIQDEYDMETPQVTQIDTNTFLVSGGITIHDLNAQLNIFIPEEEGIETLAGFLLGQFGSVPKTNSKITWNGFDFIVERVYRRRIERVRITRIEKSEKVEE